MSQSEITHGKELSTFHSYSQALTLNFKSSLCITQLQKNAIGTAAWGSGFLSHPWNINCLISSILFIADQVFFLKKINVILNVWDILCRTVSSVLPKFSPPK